MSRDRSAPQIGPWAGTLAFASASGAPRRPKATPGVVAAASFPVLRLLRSKEPEADAKRGFGMEAALGLTLGAEEKARAFGEYLKDIGLPAEQVLGDLGPAAEVEDVISFFYAGMPDRFKGGHDGTRPDKHETTPLPEEH